MAPITVPYRVRPGEDVPRPWLRVWFLVDGRKIEVPAIVDSGADGSVVPLDLASAVGLTYDPAKPLEAQGAGGAYRQFRAANRLAIESEVGPISLDRPSLNPYLKVMLLGRSDFFLAYRVRFDQRAMVMEIEPYVAAEKREAKRSRARR